MHIFSPFIRRPVATALLSLAILIAGGVAFYFLPVQLFKGGLPHDLRPWRFAWGQSGNHGVLSRNAARAPIRPHRWHHGDDVHQPAWILLYTLQFDLDRDINAASRDVQAAINAAAGSCPQVCPACRTTAGSIPPTLTSWTWLFSRTRFQEVISTTCAIPYSVRIIPSGRRRPGRHQWRRKAGGSRGFESQCARALRDRFGGSASRTSDVKCEYSQREFGDQGIGGSCLRPTNCSRPNNMCSDRCI